ncbi:hypothetical protein ACUWC2_28840, partial [Klebsiella pneumoniae]|uniref:hypothetical protein n=1 Tax=Klebsiella pneumoniae TaxID=573 RepID=UPI0040559ACD
GAATVEDALEFYNQLVSLFSSVGFSLRKFSSNSPEVLGHIPLEHHEIPLHLDYSQTVKVLGLKWNPQSDQLGYAVNVFEAAYTKRGIP